MSKTTLKVKNSGGFTLYIKVFGFVEDNRQKTLTTFFEYDSLTIGKSISYTLDQDQDGAQAVDPYFVVNVNGSQAQHSEVMQPMEFGKTYQVAVAGTVCKPKFSVKKS